MLRSFLQFSVAGLTLVSSFFILRGNLGLTADRIADLASMRWGHHPGALRALAEQGADTKAGLGVLLIAFVLQTSNGLWPLRMDDFGVSISGVVLAFAFSGGVFAVGWKVASRIAKQTLISAQEHLDRSKESQ